MTMSLQVLKLNRPMTRQITHGVLHYVLLKTQGPFFDVTPRGIRLPAGKMQEAFPRS